MPRNVKRLFKQFRPSNYQVSLIPDREKMTFSGEVNIRGTKVGPPSQRLTLHQYGLTITGATIVKHDKSGNKSYTVARINHQEKLNEVRLHVGEQLYAGSYSIQLKFEGDITRPMQGLYPCYFEYKGKKEVILATQFESHHAREVFPCIDEPEAKATFDLTLVSSTEDEVLSNTPMLSSTTNKNLKTTVFETTPVMSTYLLAFVIGKIHGITAKSQRGVEVSTWASIAQQKSHLRYANKEAVNALDFFEDYFGVPFPLTKLDQVGLPDFDSLAMENWGLVTFREVGLISDPKNPSVSGERLISQVIAHELSHQWFGNLVTMRWWDDLWLNESFATVMESLAPDNMHPEWQEWEDFTSSRVLGCANRDVYSDVQPVGVRVTHPDEILTIFDPMIVYSKGARLLKMLFDFIGEDTFKAGLASYFNKYAYKNTTREDLWAELSGAAGVDIGALMTAWIEQPGTPLLEVSQQGQQVKFSQQRFLLDGEDTKTKWSIPLLADQPLEPSILTDRTGSAKVVSKEPVILNPGGNGHFVTKYASKQLKQNVEDKIINRSLNASGRIIALNDQLLLSQRGDNEILDSLKLIRRCQREDRDAVWSVFMRVIGSAQQLTEGHKPSEDHLKKLKGELSSFWHEKLGWDQSPSDDPNTKQLRNTVLALTIASENKNAVQTALKKFDSASSAQKLPAEQRAIIAGAAVRFSKHSVIEKLMREYESSVSPDVQSAIMVALCSTRDDQVAKQIVKWGMYDENIIRPQDIDHWFAYLMRNYHTRGVAWDWLIDRWPYLLKQFGGGKKMEYFIWYASHAISSDSWSQRYKDFFMPMTDDVALKRNLLISFSEIDSRLQWRKREEAKIRTWLEESF